MDRDDQLLKCNSVLEREKEGVEYEMGFKINQKLIEVLGCKELMRHSVKNPNETKGCMNARQENNDKKRSKSAKEDVAERLR